MELGTVVAIIFGAAALVFSLLGWDYQLGYANARINRNERDIAALNTEFKKEVADSLRRLHEKFDKLPCKNPGWTKEDCGQ
jgi:hypothetical protein